jgi:hypothetical protein
VAYARRSLSSAGAFRISKKSQKDAIVLEPFQLTMTRGMGAVAVLGAGTKFGQWFAAESRQ